MITPAKPARKTAPAPAKKTAPAPAVVAEDVVRASAFLRGELMKLDEGLTDATQRVLGTARDEEAIHDLRVLLRKIRTLLKAARPIYGRFLADEVRRSFASVADLTGTLRDEEVLLELAKSFPVAPKKRDAWIALRRRREAIMRRRIRNTLRSGILETARSLLRALVLLPIRDKRDVRAESLARKTVRRATENVHALGRPSGDAIEALHDLRIMHKHLRYACELFRAVLSSEYPPIAERSARFQKRLGNIHDYDVAKIAVQRAQSFTVAERAKIGVYLDELRAEELAKYTALTEPPTPA